MAELTITFPTDALRDAFIEFLALGAEEEFVASAQSQCLVVGHNDTPATLQFQYDWKAATINVSKVEETDVDEEF